MAFKKSILKTLAAGDRPDSAAVEAALISILNGEAKKDHIKAFLQGLEDIGITADEVSVGTKVMRDNMIPVKTGHDVIDVVGTGGTGLHTLSISTATALVCAGAGAKVAKHGNRAASSLTGTADTLSALGVNLSMSPEKAAECIDKAGIGFLFAPNHHPAMRHVGPARKELGIKTLFNLLGPLCNPAGARRMLLGVAEDRWREPMARALLERGCDHVWVVHGSDGMDEITITGTTQVSEVKNGAYREFEIEPLDYGFARGSLDDLRGGEPAVNAERLRKLLIGQVDSYRDIVLLNAGA
ncbi:MAG: anthranilate phosphoribosyltransferase, partial [Hellea sp.]|nr:anthranilate phosphoribosyltransferase [Hellea sp.]